MVEDKPKQQRIKILDLEKALSKAGLSFERKIKNGCPIITYIFNQNTLTPIIMGGILQDFSYDSETLKESVYCQTMTIRSYLDNSLSHLGIRKSICEKYDLAIADANYESICINKNSIEGIIDSISKVQSALPEFEVRSREVDFPLEKFHVKNW